MSRTRHLALAAVIWLPIVGLLVLVGLAVSWWATVLGLVTLGIPAVLAARAIREIRERPEPDPAAAREELKELDRRAAPWIRRWAFGSLVFSLLFVVLLLVLAFSARR